MKHDRLGEIGEWPRRYRGYSGGTAFSNQWTLMILKRMIMMSICFLSQSTFDVKESSFKKYWNSCNWNKLIANIKIIIISQKATGIPEYTNRVIVKCSNRIIVKYTFILTFILPNYLQTLSPKWGLKWPHFLNGCQIVICQDIFLIFVLFYCLTS